MAKAASGGGFKSLRKLSQRDATRAEYEEMVKQVHAEENDRGACLLLAADLENALDYAIRQTLNLSEADIEELYNQEGPLGTFSRKISFAAAIKIIGPVSKGNLTIIRHVRNAFAHARTPITFETPEVRQVCNGLQLIRAWVGDKFVLEPVNSAASPRTTSNRTKCVLLSLDFRELHHPHRRCTFRLA